MIPLMLGLFGLALTLGAVAVLYLFEDLRRERETDEVFKALRQHRDEQAIRDWGKRRAK